MLYLAKQFLHECPLLDSAEGEGTTITIELPISEKTNEEEQVKPIPKKQRKARIMVIEDEEEVRQLLSDILVEGGHRVEVLSSGKEGIGLFQESSFDLVFTDLGMPGISGWQVAEEIKRMDRSTPVALITGWGVQLSERELKKRGIDFIVHKPFRVDQVLRLVQEGMELRGKAKRQVIKTTKNTREKK